MFCYHTILLDEQSKVGIFPHIDESQELIFQCIDWMGTNEYVKEGKYKSSF